MNKPLKPKLDVLPTPQHALWKELDQIPGQFILYGGTAIALQIGHRQSIDFDFFAFEAIDPQKLLDNVGLLKDARVIQMEPNTLTVLVDRDGPVQVSLFGTPKLGQVEAPFVVEENSINIASLVDLAGTKAAVVQRRAEVKDYIDIDALVEQGGVSLPTALAAAKLLYGEQFNPQLTLKALSYFGEGDLETVPDATKQRLLRAVAQVDLDALPGLDALRPHRESEP